MAAAIIHSGAAAVVELLLLPLLPSLAATLESCLSEMFINSLDCQAR